MQRTRYPIFSQDGLPRYVVVWDLHWKIIRCERIDARANFQDALSAEIDLLNRDGWQAESSDTRFGFVFMRRGAERTLLMLTPRDPRCDTPQSFSPFKTR
jgi:hypothetical protein